MSFCTKCGAPVVGGPNFCRKCGAPLQRSVAVTTVVQRATAATSTSPSTVATAQPQAVVMLNEKSSGLAAVLSFFWCGLGQIYTGHIGKGVVMMFAHPLLLVLGFMLTFGGCLSAAGAATADARGTAGGVLLFGLLLLLSASALWIFGMVNAYRMAERANQRRFTQIYSR
jgi:hypothetical protein